MPSRLCFASAVLAAWGTSLAGQKGGAAGYAGSAACGACHSAQLESHSKTGHAQALRRAKRSDPGPGSRAQWAFGAGAKAITWVSQTGPGTIAEHGLTFYTATKSLALTPGHTSPADLIYRTFDPVATALLCFRCHSTGPIALGANFQVQPSEPGVQCEACHGPGRAHAEAGSALAIQNPKRLTAVQINALCGSCHRQASDLDDDRDWSNAWNVRHQPAYLHRAACFRNSSGALSCLSCHQAHQSLNATATTSYDARCASCHVKNAHTTPVSARGSCVGCHMPQVAAGPNLKFTNHWIGIYDPRGQKLIPSKRPVKALQPVPVKGDPGERIVIPADASTLSPIYAMALAEHERLSGPGSAKVARAATDLGLFLMRIGKPAEAEAPLRRAVSIDERNRDPMLDSGRESLAQALDAQGKRTEAWELFRQAAVGVTPRVAARAYVKLAAIDPENAVAHYRSALAAEEVASGPASTRVAALLQEYALALRAGNRDREAEPLLRRALAIPPSDPRLTIGLLNTLGNLLEGRRQFDEAEKLERAALSLAERKLGPESVELAVTCTNLADVLWNKKSLREAGLLFRRAIGINASIYGADRPETAADVANLGMLMKDAGQIEAGTALLRQALSIYENTLGADSAQARFVRGRLEGPP